MIIKKNEADATIEKVQLGKHSDQPAMGVDMCIRTPVGWFKAGMHLVAGMRRLEGLPET